MDEVRGVVIGGDYVSWQVFYDGRSQSGKYYADNEAQAIGRSQTIVKRLICEYRGFPCYLYPDDSKWSVLINGHKSSLAVNSD